MKIFIALPSGSTRDKVLAALSAGIALDFEDHDKSPAPIFHYGTRDGAQLFFNNNFLLRTIGPRSTTFTIHHYNDLMKNRSFEPLGIMVFSNNRLFKLALHARWHGMGIGEEILVSLLKTLNAPLILSSDESLKGIKSNLGITDCAEMSAVNSLEQKALESITVKRLSNSWNL